MAHNHTTTIDIPAFLIDEQGLMFCPQCLEWFPPRDMLPMTIQPGYEALLWQVYQHRPQECRHIFAPALPDPDAPALLHFANGRQPRQVVRPARRPGPPVRGQRAGPYPGLTCLVNGRTWEVFCPRCEEWLERKACHTFAIDKALMGRLHQVFQHTECRYIFAPRFPDRGGCELVLSL